MDFLMASIKKSQELIDGIVELQLYRGRVSVRGRSSPSSLYDQNLASMELEGDFNPRNSEGFIKTNAVRLRAHRAIVKAREAAETPLVGSAKG
jgi:argininosuccinate synthase